MAAFPFGRSTYSNVCVFLVRLAIKLFGHESRPTVCLLFDTTRLTSNRFALAAEPGVAQLHAREARGRLPVRPGARAGERRVDRLLRRREERDRSARAAVPADVRELHGKTIGCHRKLEAFGLRNAGREWFCRSSKATMGTLPSFLSLLPGDCPFRRKRMFQKPIDSCQRLQAARPSTRQCTVPYAFNDMMPSTGSRHLLLTSPSRLTLEEATIADTRIIYGTACELLKIRLGHSERTPSCDPCHPVGLRKRPL